MSAASSWTSTRGAAPRPTNSCTTGVNLIDVIQHRAVDAEGEAIHDCGVALFETLAMTDVKFAAAWAVRATMLGHE